MTSTPIADSVRLALPAEAGEIAAIQRRHWDQVVPAAIAPVLTGGLTLAEMTQVWHAAIVRPPAARFRVLVAVETDRVAGFATTMPSDDADAVEPDDGQIEEFAIDPGAQRRGHGSRLMHACVDTLRADGFTRARFWVATTDDVARTFFTESGWASDGAHRELGDEDDTARFKQVRLHTAIGDPETAAPPES